MVKCPRCGHEFDLKQANRTRQLLNYLVQHNGERLETVQHHFCEQWGCRNATVSKKLRELGREGIITVKNLRVYIFDEWLLKQRQLDRSSLEKASLGE